MIVITILFIKLLSDFEISIINKISLINLFALILTHLDISFKILLC